MMEERVTSGEGKEAFDIKGRGYVDCDDDDDDVLSLITKNASKLLDMVNDLTKITPMPMNSGNSDFDFYQSSNREEVVGGAGTLPCSAELDPADAWFAFEIPAVKPDRNRAPSTDNERAEKASFYSITGSNSPRTMAEGSDSGDPYERLTWRQRPSVALPASRSSFLGVDDLLKECDELRCRNGELTQRNAELLQSLSAKDDEVANSNYNL